MAGFFLGRTLPPFDKTPETNQDLLDKLISRGLIVPDRERALRYLGFIGYYRLGGYRIPFELPGSDHIMVPGIEFDDILDLYIFDRKLRLLTLDAVERIEIAIRATIFDCFSLERGALWYTDYNNFKCPKYFSQFLNDISRRVEENKSKQPYKHFFEDYDGMMFLPSWVISDLVTFGSLSKVYKSISDTSIKKKISKSFDLPENVMETWMHCISYIRNICAHHSMLWNKQLTITSPKLARLKGVIDQSPRFYTAAVIMQDLLSTITRNSTWSERLYSLLLEDCPIDHYAMGFPPRWWKNPFWKL